MSYVMKRLRKFSLKELKNFRDVVFEILLSCWWAHGSQGQQSLARGYFAERLNFCRP